MGCADATYLEERRNKDGKRGVVLGGEWRGAQKERRRGEGVVGGEQDKGSGKDPEEGEEARQGENRME